MPSMRIDRGDAGRKHSAAGIPGPIPTRAALSRRYFEAAQPQEKYLYIV